MRVWKILGVATVAGVVAAGVAVQRKRRTYRSYDTDELRSRLHARLAAAGSPADPARAGSPPS
jgi:hypothetical protein